MIIWAGEETIEDRDNFIDDEMYLWRRSPVWVQIPYEIYCTQLQQFVTDAGVNLDQINDCVDGRIPVPNHGETFKLSDEFMQRLELNRASALPLGVAITCMPDDPDGLLLDMPPEMTERHRTLSRKPIQVTSAAEIEEELNKR